MNNPAQQQQAKTAALSELQSAFLAAKAGHEASDQMAAQTPKPAFPPIAHRPPKDRAKGKLVDMQRAKLQRQRSKKAKRQPAKVARQAPPFNVLPAAVVQPHYSPPYPQQQHGYPYYPQQYPHFPMYNMSPYPQQQQQPVMPHKQTVKPSRNAAKRNNKKGNAVNDKDTPVAVDTASSSQVTLSIPERKVDGPAEQLARQLIPSPPVQDASLSAEKKCAKSAPPERSEENGTVASKTEDVESTSHRRSSSPRNDHAVEDASTPEEEVVKDTVPRADVATDEIGHDVSFDARGDSAMNDANESRNVVQANVDTVAAESTVATTAVSVTVTAAAGAKSVSEVNTESSDANAKVSPTCPASEDHKGDSLVGKSAENSSNEVAAKMTLTARKKSESDAEDDIDIDEEDIDWDIMLMQLRQYKIRFGNLRVPEPNKDEKNRKQEGWYEVYVWVKNQRKKYKRGTLKESRMRKLKDLGLDLDPTPLHAFCERKKKADRTTKNKVQPPKQAQPIQQPYQQFNPAAPGLYVHSMPTTMAVPGVYQANQPVPYQVHQPAPAPYQAPQPASAPYQAPQPAPAPYQAPQPAPTSWSYPYMQPFQPPQYQMQHAPPAPYQQFSSTAHQQLIPAMNPMQPSIQQTTHQSGQPPELTPSTAKKATKIGSSKSKSGTKRKRSSSVTSHKSKSAKAISKRDRKDSDGKQSKKGKKSQHKIVKAKSKRASNESDTDSDEESRSSRSEKQNERSKTRRKKDWIDSDDDEISVEEQAPAPPRISKEVSDDSDEESGTKVTKTSATPAGSNDCKQSQVFRMGNFTPEEVEYCYAVIEDFKRGYLDAIQGQSISNYLARKLGCKVTRIQKKFPSLFHLKPFRLVKINKGNGDIEQEVQDARERVADLFNKFNASVEKVAAKKAAEELKNQMPPPPKTCEVQDQIKSVRSTVKHAEMVSANNIAQSNTLETAARVHAQNKFLKESQAQLTIAQNAYKNAIQQKFVHAQLQAQATARIHAQTTAQIHVQATAQLQASANANFLLQEAKNRDLLAKARLCQANAHAEAVDQQPFYQKAWEESVENAETDVAAETLCQLKGK